MGGRRTQSQFSAEVAVVDKGLEIYVEPLQRALNEKEKWNDDVRRRAGIAMLIHAFNSFLAGACLQTITRVESTRFAALPGSSQPSFRTWWRYDDTALAG